MPIDRGATLRNAEKLVRQGKLDQAIAEYVRVVEDQPKDWGTGNTLGDLYLKVGQTDKAVDQFVRIADGLADEGFLPRAGALYKKILKIKPDDEHALWQGAEIASSQGLIVDARTYLNTLLERRRGRGDQRGVAQIIIRLASLEPGDYPSRLAAARARVEVKDIEGAVRDFKEIAVELAQKGRQAEAFQALREAAALNPEDAELRDQLLAMYLAAGDLASARACATTSEQLKTVAARFDASGQVDEALAALIAAAKLDPADTSVRAQIGRMYVARGDMASAAEYLTVETAGDDPVLLLVVAELQLRNGALDEGMAIVRHVLEQNVNRRQDVALLGWTIAEDTPDVGYQLVGMSADAAISQSDWASAAAGLQEFVTRVPNHIQALIRLVEICVDGGLEATMYSAQGQLADAYITAGSATEARALAEDLVAREPWDRSNIERFRRALVLMGEPDPDAIIAERLSGQSPFMSTDFSLEADPAASRAADAAAALAPPPPPAVTPTRPAASRRPSDFAPSAQAVDLDSLFGDFESAPPPRPAAPPRTDTAEVDLSLVLQDIQKPRDDASRRSAMAAAEQDFKRGMVLFNAGDIDEAIPALQSASQAPRFRFATASVLGRIFRDRGQTAKAIEWLDKASQAPAPTPDEGYLLLYDLADLLESEGEIARALAICLELQSDAGDYRDLAQRIERLAKVQAEG